MNIPHPEWFEVLGVRLACIEILNPRGGQYTCVNRDQEWLQQWLESLNGCLYSSGKCGGGTLVNPFGSVTELVYSIRGSLTPFPYDGGTILTSSEDPWVKILVHGCDYTPERAWEANPIWQLIHRIPYKTRAQRKKERKGGDKRESLYGSPTLKFSPEEWSKLHGGYDREKSLYKPRTTTWSLIGTLLNAPPQSMHLFEDFPSKYRGALWATPDGWTILRPNESDVEIIKTGLTREEADRLSDDHRKLLRDWIDKKKTSLRTQSRGLRGN